LRPILPGTGGEGGEKKAVRFFYLRKEENKSGKNEFDSIYKRGKERERYFSRERERGRERFL